MAKCKSNCQCGRHQLGGNNKGIPHSNSTRMKISSSLKGRKPPIPKMKSCGRAHPFCMVCRPDMKFWGNPTDRNGRKITLEKYNPEKPPKISIIRRLLIEQLGKEKCSSCGWDERRPNGVCPLEIDHIDGNHQNWQFSNLQLLCPNCHSLTPKWKNYGGKTTHPNSLANLRPWGA